MPLHGALLGLFDRFFFAAQYHASSCIFLLLNEAVGADEKWIITVESVCSRLSDLQMEVECPILIIGRILLLLVTKYTKHTPSGVYLHGCLPFQPFDLQRLL